MEGKGEILEEIRDGDDVIYKRGVEICPTVKSNI